LPKLPLLQFSYLGVNADPSCHKNDLPNLWAIFDWAKCIRDLLIMHYINSHPTKLFGGPGLRGPPYSAPMY